LYYVRVKGVKFLLYNVRVKSVVCVLACMEDVMPRCAPKNGQVWP
jgi:hypothetical protein